jgi:hypothetical protein
MEASEPKVRKKLAGKRLVDIRDKPFQWKARLDVSL